MTTPSFDDAEISAHVAGQPRTKPHDQVAAELAARFGAERAWPVEMVREHRVALHGSWAGGRSIVEREPEMRAIVDDRMGLGESGPAIRQALLDRFGWAPSRSAMHRYMQRRRDVARRVVGLPVARPRRKPAKGSR